MSIHDLVQPNPYALATGAGAVRRLHVLHDIYAPAGRRVLVDAGLRRGMKVADFGCGVGVVTRMLAEMVGPSGSVTGVDVNGQQLAEAAAWCESRGVMNTSFVKADACNTGLPRGSFDLVYCRFLLLHLPDPMACLREMREVLKPGGIIVVEDGDLASASSVPPSAIDAFADLFCRFGPTRGLNYSLATNLYHMVIDAGFADVGCGDSSTGDHSRGESLLPEVERGRGRADVRRCGDHHGGAARAYACRDAGGDRGSRSADPGPAHVSRLGHEDALRYGGRE